MKTLEFPAKNPLVSGVKVRSERSAYLDGLAVLQEIASPIETLSPANRSAALKISSSAKQLPNLGPHLAACAQKVQGEVGFGGSIGRQTEFDAAVRHLHLRASMRERLVDIAVEVSVRSAHELEESYDKRALEATALERDVFYMRIHRFSEVSIAETLGVESLPPLVEHIPRPPQSFVELPSVAPEDVVLYQHTNSRGLTFYLHKTEVTLRGGKPQTIYFFAKTPTLGKGEPVALPDDRVVKENPKNGFLTVSKKK